MSDVPDVPKPASPRSRRRSKNDPVPLGHRAHGFLYCRVCTKSWAFQGTADPASWPQHRCGRDVGPFHEFCIEDPNHVPLPWKAGSNHG